MKLVSKFALSLVLGTVVLSACSPPDVNNLGVQEEPIQLESSEEVESTESAEMMEAKTYTKEEIAEHNSAEDCWLLVEDKVYDVTEYIADAKHPGGPAILQGCGNVEEDLFNARPNDGEPHSEKAQSFLPNFYIGDLAE